MARGWKCPRCSTQNGEGVINCSKCGLIQGGVFVPSTYAPPLETGANELPRLTAAEPQSGAPSDPSALSRAAEGVGAPLLLASDEAQSGSSWVPPYPVARPPSRPLWRRLPIGLLIFGVLVVGGGVAGFITNASRSSNGDITRGGDMSSSDLRVGDCWDLKDPNADTVDNVTARPCSEPHKYEVFLATAMDAISYPTDDQFSAFVENNCVPAFTSYVGLAFANSRLQISWLVPLSAGWTAGDRTVECSVYDPSNLQVTSSLRSSHQ